MKNRWMVISYSFVRGYLNSHDSYFCTFLLLLSSPSWALPPPLPNPLSFGPWTLSCGEASGLPLSGNRHPVFHGVSEPPLAVRGDASGHAYPSFGTGMVVGGMDDCQACFFARIALSLKSSARQSIPCTSPFVAATACRRATRGWHAPLKRPEHTPTAGRMRRGRIKYPHECRRHCTYLKLL